MKFPRAAGILLHISSLPGPLGIGDLGKAALEFATFLHDAGQKIWQILPLCPPANGNSPYSSYSVFAGNVNLVSPIDMIDCGWGTRDDLDWSITGASQSLSETSEVNYPLAKEIRSRFFARAFQSIKRELPELELYQEFCKKNAYWLDDFALFEAISISLKQFDWNQWPTELSSRDVKALDLFRDQNMEAYEFSRFLQFVFDYQWQNLKSRCNELDIQIYGDVPIFVDHQSADVWANQKQFQLNENGYPEFVAGVPPDYFSETGQKWGNPLYRWDIMEADGFQWWNRRFQRSLEQFDIVRVDHFRGFEAYWQIPADAPSAKQGQWVKGPGEKPFLAAESKLGQLPIVAEDLGLITEDVNILRASLDFPTMRVLQFGYSSVTDDFHRPARFPEHCFAYTGTHDNETIAGWFKTHFEKGPEPIRQLLVDEFGVTEDNLSQAHWRLVQAVLDSRADTAVIPMQDYLGLGNEARMNIPSTAEGNWRWKLGPNDAWQELAPNIRKLTLNSNRQ